jgi:hypothetical protein
MGHPSVNKRLKEKDRQERQKEKAAEREQRKKERALKEPGLAGGDPDIAGIVPGPQPLPQD